SLISLGRSGGIGRRARLRGVWANPWGSEPPLRHNRCSRRTIQPVGSLPGPPPRVLEPQIADELPDEADGEESDGHRAERGEGERRVPSRRPAPEVLPPNATHMSEHGTDPHGEKTN